MNAVDTYAIVSSATDVPDAVMQAIHAAIAAPIVSTAPCGIVDDGYAESDDTSRWIERVGEAEFV